MSYLRWYPGFGETVIFNRLAEPMKRFLAEASSEYPEFVSEYVVPVLQSPDPEGRFLADLAMAATALELEAEGLGDYEQNLGDLGHLGKSFFKRLKGALKKSLNPIKAIKGAAHFAKREAKKEIKEFKKVEKAVVKGVEKVARKYGGIILTVAGAILSPFTGGASVVVASLLIAAQKAYQAHAAAQHAKRVGRKEAAAMQRDADAQNAQVAQQVDQFYAQNQSWFVTQLGVTPDKWAQLTLDQKIGLINAGSTGQVPSSAPASSAQNTVTSPPGGGPAYTPTQSYSSGPSFTPQASWDSSQGVQPAPSQSMPSMPSMPSGGGGSTQDWSLPIPGSPGATPGAPAAQPAVAESSMFGGGGLALPAALVVGAVVLSQGKMVGGGSRKRRNPGRRRRR